MTQLCELFGVRRRSVPAAWKNHRWNQLLGIELELENTELDVSEDAPTYWAYHQDGSLRNGIELVLAHPLAGDTLAEAVALYYECEINSTNSSRTSTHIHLNMTDATVDNLRTLLVLMYTLEDGLFNTVGEARKWCGYAMSLSEMEPRRLRSILTATDPEELIQNISPTRNQERYYGLNTCMRRHGTVEFRYFPGDPTREELESWLDFVCNVKQIATTTPMSEMLDRITSEQDLIAWLEHRLSSHWFRLLMQNDSTRNMWNKFSEVAGLATASVAMERSENLVFVTDSLLTFLRANVVDADGIEYLRKVQTNLSVVSASDWATHVYSIFGKKSPPKPKMIFPVVDLNDMTATEAETASAVVPGRLRRI